MTNKPHGWTVLQMKDGSFEVFPSDYPYAPATPEEAIRKAMQDRMTMIHMASREYDDLKRLLEGIC